MALNDENPQFLFSEKSGAFSVQPDEEMGVTGLLRDNYIALFSLSDYLYSGPYASQAR